MKLLKNSRRSSPEQFVFTLDGRTLLALGDQTMLAIQKRDRKSHSNTACMGMIGFVSYLQYWSYAKYNCEYGNFGSRYRCWTIWQTIMGQKAMELGRLQALNHQFFWLSSFKPSQCDRLNSIYNQNKSANLHSDSVHKICNSGSNIQISFVSEEGAYYFKL